MELICLFTLPVFGKSMLILSDGTENVKLGKSTPQLLSQCVDVG